MLLHLPSSIECEEVSHELESPNPNTPDFPATKKHPQLTWGKTEAIRSDSDMKAFKAGRMTPGKSNDFAPGMSGTTVTC